MYREVIVELIARWWFTVDRPLLSAVLLLMAIGVLISMAASPPVAERIGLNSFHFFKFQLAFLLPAVIVLISVSLLEPTAGAPRRFSDAWPFLCPDGCRACFGGLKSRGPIAGSISVPLGLQPSELAKPSFVVIAAWFLAEHTKRPDMPGHIIAYMIFAIFVGLLVVQPDFGQTALVVLTFGAMLLIYGIPWILVLGLAGLCAVGRDGGLYAWFRMWRRALTGFSTPTRATHFRSIRLRRRFTMAACWAQVPVAAKPSKFFPMRIRISPLRLSARNLA